MCAGSNKAIKEAVSAKDSGNTPRNKHRHEAGDFVLFADDDNHYTADALSTIRRLVQHDHEALYIFQMQRTKDLIIPRLGDERVVIGNVDSGHHPLIAPLCSKHGPWLLRIPGNVLINM